MWKLLKLVLFSSFQVFVAFVTGKDSGYDFLFALSVHKLEAKNESATGLGTLESLDDGSTYSDSHISFDEDNVNIKVLNMALFRLGA
ncbi:hypothetical protein L195_g045384 [Trifolium pratense]|uniref:Uncharacterized protein n=1 Tax=Trifolium pratense TaxID=57577 RepID=A0A2K3MEP6_TRIPR|nr:hypothetical protein L195_g055640 [Trifolium pratense]PNX76798.1 hypothetical protein L195_g032757 [Trifolium pratense]PNX89265.1 hypothetical protein L195_g045384 [Trifolium pratense]